jgi:hypothetical protein
MSELAAGGTPANNSTLVTIGDIGVTQEWVVTPNGTCHVRDAHWMFVDMSRTHQRIPSWAIVCAVLFFIFCLLGLLFLLVKEEYTEGSVQVVVQGPRLVHTVQLPVWSPAQVMEYSQQVNYARALSAAAQ